MLKLTTKNNGAYRARINAILKQVHGATTKTNAETATQIAETAKSNAPVASGNLRDSISSQDGEVNVDADYSLFVEIGTQFQAPQPFLTPAVITHVDDYATLLKSNLTTVAFGGE